MTTRMVDVPPRSALEAERWFFVYMAFACVAIAFAGFISVGMLARSMLNRTEAWYAVADGLRALVH